MASTDTYNTLMSRFKKPNRQSMDRQQMQGQVYNTPGVTAPAKPALTAADVEKEKNGTNGEVVQLGNSKPAATPATAEKPATAATPQTPAEPKPALTPEDTKPAMPGLKQEKIKGLEGVDTSPKDLKGWLRWYDEQKRRAGVKSDEELEKARKRDSFIAAIGDGISALAQIHYAGKGAVVNPGTGNTLSEGVAKRHERLLRENNTRKNELLNMLRQRHQDELAKQKAKRDEDRAQQQAKHQEAQEKYWDTLGKRWERQDAEKERSDRANEDETKRNHDMTEKGKNDRAAASRKAANDRNRYNQGQQNARHAKTEAGKQARYEQSRKDKTNKTGKTLPRNNNSGNTGRKLPRQTK